MPGWQRYYLTLTIYIYSGHHILSPVISRYLYNVGKHNVSVFLTTYDNDNDNDNLYSY